MSNETTWSTAATCTGAYGNSPVFSLIDPERALNGVRLDAVVRLAKLHGARLRGMQQVQVQQGRSVSSGTSPIAPTAHKAATQGGVSGPYPWRPPV